MVYMLELAMEKERRHLEARVVVSVRAAGALMEFWE